MIRTVSNWLNRYFSDPDVIGLLGVIIAVVLIFVTMGDILAPVFVAVVLAYLLQAIISRLESFKIPHKLAVILVYLGFLGVLAIGLLGILPSLWRQLTTLFQQLPDMVLRGQALLAHLPDLYPSYISAEQIQNILVTTKGELARGGQVILSASLAKIASLIALCIYLVLVPMLIYFFLIDRAAITQWIGQYLPKRQHLLSKVWDEVHEQIGNYVRGKVLEMLIVGIVSCAVFALMNLQYALLLGVLVGVSVIIPYIGAVLVTIPIVIVGLSQWGWSQHFAYFMAAYSIIIALDANILVPVLFAEVVRLHPVSIIIAVLVFGGLLGFWGVFFAIPLACLVKAILTSWPRHEG